MVLNNLGLRRAKIDPQWQNINNKVDTLHLHNFTQLGLESTSVKLEPYF